MIRTIRTNSDNPDFIELVKQLDADLAQRDGEDFSFFAQFNQLDTINHVVVAYDHETALGCGAIKHYEEKVMEIKRMYTLPSSRGKGVASRVLAELEKWAKELAYEKCILETGIKQPEAIGLYRKSGYRQIPNYGQYAEVEESQCFEKLI